MTARDAAAGAIDCNDQKARWAQLALSRLAGAGKQVPTPLVPLAVRMQHCRVFLKDESVQPTGSIKIRLARQIFEDAIWAGQLGPSTSLYDASSGSTAIAEAAVAYQLGLSFTAVLPRGTSPAKIKAIESYGARVLLVDDLQAARDTAQERGARPDSYFLNQFGFAARCADQPGECGLGRELFDQVRRATGRDPSLITLSVGTGHSLAAIAHEARASRAETKICLADPDGSDLIHIWSKGPGATAGGSGECAIEGIGGRDRPGFRPSLVDHAVSVDDASSVAAARALSTILGKRVGGSTGTAFWALIEAASSNAAPAGGVYVSLIYDDGGRYQDTIYSDEWAVERGLDLGPSRAALSDFFGFDVSRKLA